MNDLYVEPARQILGQLTNRRFFNPSSCPSTPDQTSIRILIRLPPDAWSDFPQASVQILPNLSVKFIAPQRSATMDKPLDLSENDRFYLFGVGCDNNDYTAKVRAAQCFYEVRKLADAQKAKLAQLGRRQFARNHAMIQGNMIKSLTDSEYSQLLLPLVTKDLTLSGLKTFILGCYTLTPGLTKDLTARGLTPLFPGLFKDVIGVVSILPDTLEEIVQLIGKICGQNHSGWSTALSNALDVVLDVVTNPRIMSQESPHEPATMPTDTGSFCDVGETGCLQVSRDALEAAMNDTIDPNEIPHAAERGRAVIQMIGADASRVEKLFENSPILDAIKTSRQWRWERLKDASSGQLQQQTNSIIALVYPNEINDISLVIKVGYMAGWEINTYLKYDSSNEQRT
ncbi:uncharacterized protein FMAN_02073 [Fusarium mangiferae]|uniref:Uncharacterized protein n=1 Tax=Fusarium mangiferae TaxID=192010 RepID=A0A1L7SL69_FUSMA|nr:uncharacterized protein FMAN_02073 [Fusarium mangiferae]CVK85173.1 uncharacterized protein FMAN_02073 [Fusarium mangiferae]